mmetsp:Transcript_5919/g.12662  ORF Transcript_5919/g.12662 Transcript_5919/m.12662 type:complete len:451 (-) Transcript_5919:178-1530(-)
MALLDSARQQPKAFARVALTASHRARCFVFVLQFHLVQRLNGSEGNEPPLAVVAGGLEEFVQLGNASFSCTVGVARDHVQGHQRLGRLEEGGGTRVEDLVHDHHALLLGLLLPRQRLTGNGTDVLEDLGVAGVVPVVNDEPEEVDVAPGEFLGEFLEKVSADRLGAVSDADRLQVFPPALGDLRPVEDDPGHLGVVQEDLAEDRSDPPADVTEPGVGGRGCPVREEGTGGGRAQRLHRAVELDRQLGVLVDVGPEIEAARGDLEAAVAAGRRTPLADELGPGGPPGVPGLPVDHEVEVAEVAGVRQQGSVGGQGVLSRGCVLVQQAEVLSGLHVPADDVFLQAQDLGDPAAGRGSFLLDAIEDLVLGQRKGDLRVPVGHREIDDVGVGWLGGKGQGAKELVELAPDVEGEPRRDQVGGARGGGEGGVRGGQPQDGRGGECRRQSNDSVLE